MLKMKQEDKIYQTCVDGMPVAEVRERSSIKFINELRQHSLISITHLGRIKLTSEGKVARRMGLSNYLSLDDTAKEHLAREVNEVSVENKGFIMVLGGFLVSLLFFLGYWFVNFQN